MVNKLSLKIGMLFFFVILIIEGLLYFILYMNLASERIEEIINNLLARGNTHSEVLEDNFEATTLEHVGLMESASEFVVIITDEAGKILVHSDPVQSEMTEVIERTNYDSIPSEGVVIEDRWKDRQFIATDSPITINKEHRGHVFMFAHTNQVKRVLDHLSNQFLFIGIITVVLTIITIFILSRFITLPLMKIKRATEQLSEGNHFIGLHTERRDELGELAQAITSLSNDLDRLKNERNEFLASISHELRTPLTYMKGYADIVYSQALTDADLKEYISIIREETENLSILIKHLFELAKMDQHSFPIRREKVFLKQLVTSIVDFITPVLEKKDVALFVRCPNHISCYIDPNCFQQVLLNILDNANKYSVKGGEIKLEVKDSDRYIEIIVRDQGEGIPKTDLPYVFDRLYRVEKSRSRKNGGSGLGLAIAKEIVEAHDGIIQIYSEQDVGTKVIIKVPKGEVIEECTFNR
ncbi:HAMP domain-containing sensor histidine kinase [Virgibacillus salarius]|uniref:HAMP domain-containing sensor histidine kinase n=1 Tax=Virgibacillus salarius TaxID=447199 RepID=UPI0031DB5D48